MVGTETVAAQYKSAISRIAPMQDCAQARESAAHRAGAYQLYRDSMEPPQALALRSAQDSNDGDLPGMTPCDYLIVGGGAAGCVLAGRLSADPSIRVMLIEAGQDMAPGAESKAIRDPFPAASADPETAWPGLHVELGADPGDGAPVYARQYQQGRVMGGSSSINGMMAQRGLPADFDEWEALGATGWGWKDVLPYFNRLEHDWDFGGPLHGKEGPIPIRRAPRSTWPPFPRAVAEELEAQGYPYEPDCNGFFGDCVTVVPLNNTPAQRVSASMAYLDAKVRQRPNLTIVAEAVAERLLLTDGRVTGVEVRRQGRLEQFHGSETLVCGGAIQSPALLMRSGIGPAAHLRSLGIPVVKDLAGVGRNLNNHGVTYIAVHLPKTSKHDREKTDCWATSMVRYSSRHPQCPPGDMQVFLTSRTSWHPLGWRIGALALLLYKPFSRGSVELRSADPAQPPQVKMRLLSDPRDWNRMVDGLAQAARVLASERVRAVTNESFMPAGGRAHALNHPSRLNWLKSSVITMAFDLSDALRRFLLRDVTLDLERLTRDRQACEEVVRKHAAGVHHVSGTCRIGRHDDPAAVVDVACRVHGVPGLRVVDASVMPTVVAANTFLPVVMIGEKVAQAILDERHAADRVPAVQARAPLAKDSSSRSVVS